MLLHLAFDLCLFLFEKAVGHFLKERFELDKRIIAQVRLLLYLHIKLMDASVEPLNFLSDVAFVDFSFFKVALALFIIGNDKFIATGTVGLEIAFFFAHVVDGCQ